MAEVTPPEGSGGGGGGGGDGGDDITTTEVPLPIPKEYSLVPVIAISVFWAIIGIVVPLLIPKRNPNRR